MWRYKGKWDKHSGKGFYIRPLPLVAGNSGRYFHGYSVGQIAAIYEWLCDNAQKHDNHGIYDALSMESSIGHWSPQPFSLFEYLPHSMTDMVCRALFDYYITEETGWKSRIWIGQKWEWQFFDKTNDYLRGLNLKYHNKRLTLKKQWNPSHDDARLVYSIKAKYYPYCARYNPHGGEWFVYINYGCDNEGGCHSEWGLCMGRNCESSDIDFKTPGMTNKQFDEAVCEWLRNETEAVKI